MHSTVFDINNEITSVDSLQCTLIIEIGKQFLNFAVTDAANNVMALKYYHIEYNTNNEWVSGLEDILNTDAWLQQQYRQVIAIYTVAGHTLIPDTYFDVAHNRAMLDLVHGNLHKGVTLSEKVFGWDVYNVYRVPTEVHELLLQQFPNVKSWHYQTLALQYSDKMDSSRADKLVVSFYQQCIMLIAIKNKTLQLVQCFEYETPEDIAYYLLQTCKALDMPPATMPVYMDGMVEINSAMYNEVKKYFGAIHVTALPEGVAMPVVNDNFPQHFFSPLLKMMVCVL